MDKEKILNDIFNSDPLGILEVKSKNSNTMNAEDRLIFSFEEINEFYKKYNREPERNISNVSEYQLYTRLKGIRENIEKIEALKSCDKFNLLEIIGLEIKKINSIDDLFDSDTLDLLGEDTQGLFDLKHIPQAYERESADFIAKRKPCKNFEKYENKFKKIQKELVDGTRKLIEFKYDLLKEGNYYVHNGILLYLESVKLNKNIQTFNSGTHNRPDGRTKIIFENGTISNMMFQSLYKGLHSNGKAISNSVFNINQEFSENFGEISKDDNEVGYIYVLRSKSNDKRIVSIDNLFKIGYSKNEVENRIKNAENEPTYLMAPVSVVTSWKCYNMNPQKLEQLLHVFFGTTCLNIDVIDNTGKRCTPREWFIVPFKIIEQAIELIISGEVIHYRYDKEHMVILER